MPNNLRAEPDRLIYRAVVEAQDIQAVQEPDYIRMNQEIMQANIHNLVIKIKDGQLKFCFEQLDSTKNIYLDEIPTEEQIEEMDGVYLTTDRYVLEEEYTNTCKECGKRVSIQGAVIAADTDEVFCPHCAQALHQCDRCGRRFEETDEWEEVYEDYDHYLGYYCRDCQDDIGASWDEDDERMYVNTGRTRVKQHLNPKGILAQGYMEDCPDCMSNPNGGLCPRHLREKAKEIEKEETNHWIYDTARRNYHQEEHNYFKRLKFRMPHEHPYLYYGIELECLWSNRYNREEIVKKFITATEGLFVSEYDRSVDDLGCSTNQVGAEFISRPTSYQRWTDPETIKLLETGMKVIKDAGGTVRQPDGCGLHVHMSKDFFVKNLKKFKKPADVISDMDWFFQFYQQEVEIFSDRPYNNYCASKAIRLKQATADTRNNNLMFGIKGKFQLEKGKMTVSQGSGNTHHDCIIDSNKGTIEARTFRSTLDVNRILATIEFCRGLAHAARKRKGLVGRTFGDILFSSDCKYLPIYIEKLKIPTDRKLKNSMEISL